MREASSHVDAQTTCCYADDPVLRPDCEHRAVVAYGPMALCRSCDARRSTIGKGMVGRSLVHGRDWSALEAVETAVGQLATAEEQLAGAVVAARRLGHSWGELGVALGVTRQAAQQRFSRRPRLWTLVSSAAVDNPKTGLFLAKGVDTEGVPKRRKTLPPIRVRGRWGWTRVIETPAGLSPGIEGSPGRAPADPRWTVPPDLMTSDGPPLRTLSGSRRNLNFQ